MENLVSEEQEKDNKRQSTVSNKAPTNRSSNFNGRESERISEIKLIKEQTLKKFNNASSQNLDDK